MQLSPKYLMSLIKEIEDKIWTEYKSYSDVRHYLEKWQICYNDYTGECNFCILEKDNTSNIDLSRTLHNIDSETLLKIAIDLGIDTPDFIPCIPLFRNKIKSEYQTAHKSFEKAFNLIEEDPSTAIGLANSTLECVIKQILNDKGFNIEWNERDTLESLIRTTLKCFKISPEKQFPKELCQIGSSLISACQAIEKLRSDKTLFHGKTEKDFIIDDSLYTYFIINTICTVGFFLISFYEKKNSQKTNSFEPKFQEDIAF